MLGEILSFFYKHSLSPNLMNKVTLIICIRVLKMVISLVVVVIWIVTLYLNQIIKISYILQRKWMKMFPMYLKCKIMDYRMVLTLMLCYLHPHFINIPICTTIMNIITPLWMVKYQHQKTHQFLHHIRHLSIQQMKKYVHYRFQYTIWSCIRNCLKFNKYLLGVHVV